MKNEERKTSNELLCSVRYSSFVLRFSSFSCPAAPCAPEFLNPINMGGCTPTDLAIPIFSFQPFSLQLSDRLPLGQPSRTPIYWALAQNFSGTSPFACRA